MSQSSKLDVHPFEVIFRHFVRYMPVSKHRKICQTAEALLRACLSLFRISICGVYPDRSQILLKQCECALMAEFAQLLEPLLTAQVIGHVDATLANGTRVGRGQARPAGPATRPATPPRPAIKPVVASTARHGRTTRSTAQDRRERPFCRGTAAVVVFGANRWRPEKLGTAIVMLFNRWLG